MEKHTAIFKGKVYRYIWEYDCNKRKLENLKEDYSRHLRWKEETRANTLHDLIKNFKITHSIELKTNFGKIIRLEEIWRGDIPRPILQNGEELWINELELLVRIDKSYRTTSGEMIYEVSHIVEIIHDEYTEKSRQYAINEWFENLYPELKIFDELKSEFIEPEPEPEPDNLCVEEKPKEKTWFGWLNFFKND